MDLITLAQAGVYLQLTSTQWEADPMLPALISGASQEFLTQTSLKYIAEQAFTERRNGTGTTIMTMRNRPLQSITSLVINNVPVKASPDGVQAGYFFDLGGTAIYLVGGFTAQSVPFLAIGFQGYPGRFTRGYGNVFVNGTAGYPNGAVAGEVQTVPSNPGPYQVLLAQAATFLGAASLTVTYQNTGLALAQVTGTPAVGQYVVASNGVLTFAAADAGVVMLCSYATIGIPLDIQKCVYEMVGWAYKSRDRIGKGSSHFADQLSEVYRSTPFSDMSKLTILRYTRKDAVIV